MWHDDRSGETMSLNASDIEATSSPFARSMPVDLKPGAFYKNPSLKQNPGKQTAHAYSMNLNIYGASNGFLTTELL